MGLPCNENHLVFRWTNHDCKILFSCAEKQDGLSCHFASDKKGLRLLKKAINEWCDFVFSSTDYTKILAVTGKESINRLIKKCGFIEVIKGDSAWLYWRVKE